MKKFLIALATGLLIASNASAEVKTYTGTDEYIMSEFETIDIAKQRARQKAERNAQEQAGVFISGYSKTNNFELVDDEIISIVCGIMNVIDVKYSTEPMDDVNGFLIRATVKANIETDDVGKWLEKGVRERSTIVAQNKELQQAVAKQDETINKLKAQIRRLTADGKLSGKRERDKISAEVAAEDKVFQSNRKIEECRKLYYDGDYKGVVNLCDEAIKIDANNATAYALRGAIYKEMENYDAAIADLSKAIELKPDYAAAYNDRGTIYQAQQNFSQAFADYDKGIQLDPNEAAGYVNRGMIYLAMSKFDEAIADANKAIQLKSNFAEAYALRGGAYIDRSGIEAEKVLEDLNRAIELNPNMAFAYYCRALLWQAVGDEASAQADYDKVKALSGKDLRR